MAERSVERDEKRRALDLALSQIEKQYGKGAIMKLGTADVPADVPAISTGSLALDVALGVGGFPRGRVIEIFGPEASGKTTLTLHAIAEAQRAGGIAAFIDAEHALDLMYARRLGVNTDDLLVSQPDTGEQALEIAETLVRSGAVDIIVVDSVAALVPRAEIEGEMGDAHMGLQARLMSQALRKLTAAISKSQTTVIFINQIRMKLGVMFGNPETTTGGNALKFYSSVRLDIRRIESIKEGQDVTGSRVRVKVVKNKMAPPFKQAEFDILFAEGISKAGELVDVGVEKRVLEKSGAWYSYKGERLGQGREAVRDFLKSNPLIANEIEARLRELAGVPGRGERRMDNREASAETKEARPAREPKDARLDRLERAERAERVDEKRDGRGDEKRAHAGRAVS
jgi:recombination protein RecA